MTGTGEGLTLGVEEEIHVVDIESWQLAARAAKLLSHVADPSFATEMQRTTVETRTDPTTSLEGLRSEIVRLRTTLSEAAAAEGLGLAASGTAPLSSVEDFDLTGTGRYRMMQEQYRMLVDEQLICGLQIHVGVADRDLAVLASQRVSWILPVLLALSASSPFWNGADTGYASIRSIMWQRWPSAGPTGPLTSAADYDGLVEDLIRTGVLADPGMAYFDVRPSDHVPTLELRVCDACPVVDDAVMIAGLFRAAVRQALEDIEEGIPHRPIAVPLQRAAMWQAARGGLSGSLLDDQAHPQPVEAEQVVQSALERLRPHLEKLGDFEEVSTLVESTLAHGNSADRQRAAFAERGKVEDVVSLVVHETMGPAAGPPPAVEALRDYRARAGDEAVVANAQPRASYGDIITFLRSLDDNELDRRVGDSQRWALERDLGFVVDQNAEAFEVDLVPRIIREHEWAVLKAGVAQRARAIECFLQDVYGDGRVFSEGLVPSAPVLGAPGWREEARRLPPETLRAPVLGFDLVRNEFGDWRVLEDNARSPSGALYAIAVRELLDAIMPDMPRPLGLANAHDAIPMLRRAVLGPSGPDGTGAVLSSGPSSGAWFEHRSIAERAGLLLVQPADLRVVDGRVLEREGGRVVDALYLRMDGELIDLTDDQGRPIGREILEVAERGDVFLANAPGNGVADDKAVYCYLPSWWTSTSASAPCSSPCPPTALRTRPSGCPCWSGSGAGHQAGGRRRRRRRADRSGRHGAAGRRQAGGDRPRSFALDRPGGREPLVAPGSRRPEARAASGRPAGVHLCRRQR